MKQNMIHSTSLTNEEVEKCKRNLRTELFGTCELFAEEDGNKAEDLGEDVYRVKVVNVIVLRVQEAISFIRSILQPASTAHNSRENEIDGESEMKLIANKITDKRLLKQSKERERDQIKADAIKVVLRKWFPIIVILAALLDAVFGYSNFRNGGLSVPYSAAAAIVLAALVASGNFLFSPWVRKANSHKAKMVRVAITFIIAFATFFIIGNLRATAANRSVDLALDGAEVSVQSSTGVNPFAIAFVTIALFGIVFGLSMYLSADKSDIQNEYKFGQLTKEIDDLTKETKELEEKQKKLKESIISNKSVARAVYDYCVSSFKECKGIGELAAAVYQKNYTRYKGKSAPFFGAGINHSYDESLHFFNQNTTADI